MTIIIQLDSPLAEPLERLARGRGCTVEELARSALADYVRSAEPGAPLAGLDPALAQAVADSFRENDELYRRLAK